MRLKVRENVQGVCGGNARYGWSFVPLLNRSSAD